MGDYTKLIVNCNVKASKEEIELALKETGIIVGLTLKMNKAISNIY